MHIHARTADWNQTVYDPYVNMLRGTTEAMSATIAGVHSGALAQPLLQRLTHGNQSVGLLI